MTVNKTRDFWQIPLDQLLVELGVTPQGLTVTEAEDRLRQFGPNSLARESRFAPVAEVLRLFLNPLVLILLGAAIVSAVRIPTPGIVRNRATSARVAAIASQA